MSSPCYGYYNAGMEVVSCKISSIFDFEGCDYLFVFYKLAKFVKKLEKIAKMGNEWRDIIFLNIRVREWSIV